MWLQSETGYFVSLLVKLSATVPFTKGPYPNSYFESTANRSDRINILPDQMAYTVAFLSKVHSSHQRYNLKMPLFYDELKANGITCSLEKTLPHLPVFGMNTAIWTMIPWQL